MKLFLASEAKNEKTFPEIKNFIGGFNNKRILYIPTAANGESMYGEWRSGTSYNKLKSTNAEVKELILEETQESDIEKDLKQSDVIWFAGGATGYLLYWIYRRKLDQLIYQYLDKGLLYVGSSAGSMITSKDQDFSEWYIEEPEPGADRFPGLDLVSFNFYPHYKDELYTQIEEKYKKGRMYLVKDGEAIILEDGKVTVIGEERKIVKE